jgi:transcriptional regulator with XRE-family HTH domain
MISPSQCRAARALLNWSQPELAEKCDMHVQTISNFENETSTPSKTTLLKIITIIQQQGIALLDNDGIQRTHNITKQYDGIEGFRAFMDDVYETSRTIGGEICLLNAKPDNWIKWLGAEWMGYHTKRMEEISDRFTFRITTQEGERNFISKSFAEYRWVPKEIWNQHSYYAYGDKIAFLNFEDNNVHILVITHKHFAQTHKFLFNLVWDQHTIIPE